MQLFFLPNSHSLTRWLPALLITALLPQNPALPLSPGRRLSTISPEADFNDLDTANAFLTTSTGVIASLTTPAGENLNYAVSIPDGVPVLAKTNMFSSWQQPVGPSSLMETLQTTLNRLIASAKFNLGLPTPLAFVVGFTLMFLFVLGSLFSVFLLWRIEQKIAGGRIWGSPLRDGREGKTVTSNGREFVIRSRPVARITLRPRPRLSPKRGILSPSSSRSSSASSDSPCPKRVRWVDEESGCPICAESGGRKDVDLLRVGIDIEMEKAD